MALKNNQRKSSASLKNSRSLKKPRVSSRTKQPQGLLSKLKITHHSKTGKLIHHRHTSHGVLMLMLLFVGVVMYFSNNIAQAQTETISHSLTVGMVVEGPPPIHGAIITSPSDGDTTTNQNSDINGTCEPSTIVTIYDNGLAGGSTQCTSAGIFTLTISLSVGDNALQALNYDSLNQAGPVTPTVTVTLTIPPVGPGDTSTPPPTTSDQSGNVTAVTPVVATPLPEAELINPILIPALAVSSGGQSVQNPCASYTGKAPTYGGQLKVNIVCMVRNLQTFSPYQLGLLVQGGVPPYAVSLKWGSGSQVGDTLQSIVKPSYSVITFSYPVPGEYVIKAHVSDSRSNNAYTQTVTIVDGETSTGVLTTIKNDIFKTSWFQTPVPIYLMAVTLTLGFWIGDIFDHKFGSQKPLPKNKHHFKPTM